MSQYPTLRGQTTLKISRPVVEAHSREKRLGDGKLVSGSVDRTVRVWNVADGQCERVMRAHNGAVSSISVLDDGRVLSTSGPDTAEMFMWSPSTLQAPGTVTEKAQTEM